MNKSVVRRDSLKASGLLLTSMIIVMLPLTARVAKGLDPITNWPNLKTLLHSEADKHPVRLSRGSGTIIDATKFPFGYVFKIILCFLFYFVNVLKVFIPS